jgi:hypothetical protein
MRVTMMLADHTQVADGKLFISGAGWTFCGPGPVPCAVAMLFHVPWQQTNEKISFELRLVDEDGRPAMQPGAEGQQPIGVTGQLEAGRPPGMLPGAEINVPIAFNVVLNLPPDRRFTWILEAEGHTDEDWRLSFATRQTPVTRLARRTPPRRDDGRPRESPCPPGKRAWVRSGAWPSRTQTFAWRS